MKKLLLLIVLGSCCDSKPDHKATVVLNYAKQKSDTVIINYYQNLILKQTQNSTDLVDGNNSKFGECQSFSIIEEVEIGPHQEIQDTTSQ